MKKVILVSAVIILSAILAIYFFYNYQIHAEIEKPQTEWSWKKDWYQSFELQNGLKVIVIPNSKIPAVSHMLWYKIGAQHEPVGKSGIAHFLEHLLFKGTEKFPDGEFSKIVAQNGGRENAFTSQDFTAYYQNIHKDKLPLVMEMEADRMRGLTLQQEAVDKERAVILEERNSRTDNNPRALLQEQIDAAMFRNHAYGTPIIGWRHEMESLTKQDAFDFYKKYYAPNNAFLILAGDITLAEAKPLAEKYYGVLEPSEDISKIELIEPPQNAERKVILRDERVQEPELWLSYYAPSYKYGETHHSFALTILSKILGDGQVSRIYKNLVKEQGIASIAGSSYSALRIGPSEFTLYALPASGVALDELKKGLEAEIQTIILNGITDEELASAKKSMIAEMVYSREGLQSLAYIVGQVVSVGLKPDFVSEWTNNIEAVTAKQVQEAAKHIFDNDKLVVGELLSE